MEAKKSGGKKIITHLDSCLVLIEGEDRGIGVIGRVHTSVPDHQQVIISPTGKIFTIRRPLQSTHLLGVSGQSCNMVVCHTDIMMVNGTTSTPAGNKARNKRHVSHQTVLLLCYINLISILFVHMIS